MLKKLKIFKEFYKEGIVVPSVQADEEQREKILTKIESFFVEIGKDSDYTIKSAFDVDGIELGRNSFSFISSGVLDKRFLKINLPGLDSKKNLYMQYCIYKEAYKDIQVSFYDIDDNLGMIEMTLLNKCQIVINPLLAKLLIEEALQSIGNISFVSNLYGIEDILRVAKEEVAFLKEKGLIKSVVPKTLDLFMYLEDKLSSLPKKLCHGDYGDANILQNESGKLIVIDWEDVFLGIPNYDYLYWLTFFNHRKYYNEEIFGSSHEEIKLNISIAVMILIIKEAMSVYNGEFLKNKFTAEDRIKEITQYL